MAGDRYIAGLAATYVSKKGVVSVLCLGAHRKQILSKYHGPIFCISSLFMDVWRV